MSDSTLTQVNEHYLDQVMDLSLVKEVEASEDIYAANGMKLIAKGARLSNEMQERLILHRLKKPLESSISVNDGVGMKEILAEAQRLTDADNPLQPLLGGAKGKGALLTVLSRIPLNHSLTMLLSLVDHSGENALPHHILASLLASSLARQLNLADDKQQSVATAALFHDVGKLYINPAYLRPGQKLKPAEWRQVVSHPVIGQKVLAEVGGLNTAVTRAVLEHHERYSGNGYPQRLAGNAISIEGQVLAVAEILASMSLQQELTLQRAELALRIVPGEHALPIVSVLSRTALDSRVAQAEAAPLPADVLIQESDSLLKRLHALVKLCADLCAAPTLQSETAASLLRRALARLHLIQQALASTGVDVCAESQQHLLAESVGSQDSFEIHGVILEIDWRISELARDLILGSERLAAQELAALEPLIALLEEGATPEHGTDHAPNQHG